MSEGFLAAASVLIRPDTTTFRAQLEAGLAAATRGVVVPVNVVASAAGVGTAAAAAKTETALLAQGAVLLSAAQETVAVATNKAADAEAKAALAAGSLTTAKKREIAALEATVASTISAAEAASLLTAANEAMAVSEDAVVTAQRAGITAAEEEALILKQNAKAAAEAAAAHETLARGVGASSLSLLGIRGATLAASAPFLVGAAAVTTLTLAIKESVSEQEAAARVAHLLGEELGAGSERWAHTLANSFSLSATDALKFEGALLEILHNAGLVGQAAQQLSQSLVERAADVAAFNNAVRPEVLQAFGNAIQGNLRGLRAYEITLTQAQVKEEALRETGKKHAADLTRLELVQARINLLLADSANQAGAAAEQQNRLAGTAAQLSASLSNIGTSFGKLLLPVLSAAAKEVQVVVDSLQFLIDKANAVTAPVREATHSSSLFGDALKALGVAALVPISPVLAGVAAYKEFTQATNDATSASAGLAFPLGFLNAGFFTLGEGARTLGGALRGLVGDFDAAAAAANTFQLGLEGAQQHLLDLQFQGASSAAQIATLRREIEQAQAGIAAKGASAADIARFRAERNAAQSQIQQIQAQDAAAAKAAHDKAVAAAKAAKAAAQAARDAQDQQFAFELGQGQAAIQLRQLRAQQTKSLQDDINVERANQRFLQREIELARVRIHDEQQRRSTISELKNELEQSHQAEQALIAQQEQNRIQEAEAATQFAVDIAQASGSVDAQIAALTKQIQSDKRLLETTKQSIDQRRKLQLQIAQDKASRQQLIADRAASVLELDIEIAQAKKSVAGEIAARQARIKADQELLKSVKGDIVRRRQLQLEIIQDTQAIKDLKKQQDQKNDAAKQLAFSFLQQQQGFAANLLSNLLPGGAARSALAAQPSGVAPAAPAVPGPGGAAAAGAATAAAGAAGGATQGQLAQLIQISMEMLRALQAITGSTKHPQARNQVAMALSDMAFSI